MRTTDVRPTPSLAPTWRCTDAEPLEVLEHVAALLAGLVLEHYPDGADVLATIATQATEMLPRGMSLVDGRPGSWEADLVEQLVRPDAVAAGPGPTALDLDCPRCGASPGSGCWNPRTYDDVRHAHRERVDAAKVDGLSFVAGMGWL
jgi:hypothetical protein